MAKRKKKGAIASQKEQIHNFYKEFNDRIYTLNDLFNYLDVYDDDDKVFVKLILEDLVDEGKLVQVGRGRFALSEKMLR